MNVSRPAVLAALLLLAVVAPAAAFALSDDDNPGTAHHATHPGDAKQDDAGQDDAGKPDHATGHERADETSGPGREHAEAMKEWARCVADAASGPKTGEHTGPPKDACGDKPMGPGRAKHLAAGTGPFAPGRGDDHRPEPKPKSHGRSGR